MRFNETALQDLFTYHPQQGEQEARYANIRKAALQFATILVLNTPESADQTAAIRKLRECVMTANASIALQGKF